MLNRPPARGALLSSAVLLAVASLSNRADAQGFGLDYRPNAREVVLDTVFTQIQPTVGPPINVAGGVFVFDEVTIPQGTTVRGIGANPMIWICRRFVVEGELSVDGEDGRRVDSLNSAFFPTPGGRGGPAAGTGGQGSPDPNDRSISGEIGYGPFQAPNAGGGGGRLSCIPSCNRASGGGGGSFVTQGDPDYGVSQPWAQVFGVGGAGCLNFTLPGGAAGARPFDATPGNDFWGLTFVPSERRLVLGELAGPLGGSGGGGGGDRAPVCTIPDPTFASSDNKGGGGGGGGGALVIYAIEVIHVGATGRISADGGHGGGGEQAGGNNQGGGGGGGSGGMIVLASSGRVRLHVKGETHASSPDGRYVVSADGGIGTQGIFGGVEIGAKYPLGSNRWSLKPAGGFGGLGLIQIHVPLDAGPNGANADGTNTWFDDRIDLIGPSGSLSGAEKQRYLGWRGHVNIFGSRIDDAGNAVNLGVGVGDLRGDVVLVPLL